MNPALLIELLAQLAPALIADGGQAFQDVAHGEGGVAKITKVLADLGTLMGHAALGVASVASSGIVAPPAPPAPVTASIQPAATAAADHLS